MQTDWIANPPKEMAEKAKIIARYKHLLNSPGKKGKALRALVRELKYSVTEVEETARQQDPLSFFKPSYEQMLILNAWLYGIQFICIYTANRIGKTTAEIINFLLWIFPNSPKWRRRGILRQYRVGDAYDIENMDNENQGKLVQVFARPPIEKVKKIYATIKRLGLRPDPSLPHYHPTNRKVLQRLQKEIPDCYQSAFPYAPWNSGGQVWVGAPDNKHHTDKIMPLWKQYIPTQALMRFVPTEREITIKIVGQKRTTVWEYIGLSFESKETKWASGATEAILLTEGVPMEIFKEAKLRFKDVSIGGHDFTPYDPANTSHHSALAQRIKQGREGMPLPHHVFEKFSVYTAPRHIISDTKKEGLIASFKNDPQGRARLDGEFYTSSALILSNLSRDIHLLDWSIEEMFRRYPTGRIYRAVDPGLDHPTACAWGLLLPSNQWIIYRMMSERGLDIATRCKRIIELSNNSLAKKRWGKGPKDYFLQEVQNKPNSETPVLTIADYHTFKKDETTGLEYSLNYTLNGLVIVPSVHIGPEERGLAFDTALKPDIYQPHIGLSPSVPPGPKVFFLQNGPGVMEAYLKWEEFYWERITQGPNKGEAKDKMPDHGDDELDAASYLICSPYVWTTYSPRGIFAGDAEPETHLMQASRQLNDLKRTGAALINHAQRDGRQVVVFSGGEALGDVDGYDDLTR